MFAAGLACACGENAGETSDGGSAQLMKNGAGGAGSHASGTHGSSARSDGGGPNPGDITDCLDSDHCNEGTSTATAGPDAGVVIEAEIDECTFRGHVSGGGLAQDQAQKNHQSLIDSHGDLVIVGSFSGTLDAGGMKLDAGGQLGAYVIKLDDRCHVRWARVFASEANSALWIVAVASDDTDHLYIGGGFNGQSVLGDSTSAKGSGFAGFVLQLDGDGNTTWSHVYKSTYNAVAVTDLVSDSQHRVTFVGYAGFDASFGGAPIGLISASSMPFIAQLHASDGSFAWSHSFTDADLLYGLANSPHDDGFVLTGWATNSINLGNGPLTLGKGSRFLAKLDSQGQPSWAHALPHGADIDQWNWWKGGVVADTFGNIVVLRDEPFTLPGDSGARVLDDSVEKYTVDGAPSWQTRLSPDSTWEHEWGSALTSFSDSHPLRFGSFLGTTTYAGQAITSRGGSDVALIELGPEGIPLWTHTMGDALDDRVLTVAVDSDDHIFATYASTTDDVTYEQDLVVTKLRRPR
ncbi:MAG TPA: hypothetical protein VHM19_09800 [Polyangiales bacterium]|nr:hypothetical protein [Polyangiales bacterium]